MSGKVRGVRWTILLLLCASLSSCTMWNHGVIVEERAKQAQAKTRLMEAEAEAAELRLQRSKEGLLTEAQWEHVTRAMEAVVAEHARLQALKDAQDDKGKR